MGGGFDCYDNNLTSLEGSPKQVGGDFTCSGNEGLTTLKGSPETVGGKFDCSYNYYRLTTLEGSPKQVGGKFDCTSNKLTTLKGSPERIGGSFHCNYNNLTTLLGGPKQIGGGWISFRGNNLVTLEGFPLSFKEDIDINIEENPVDEVYMLFDDPRAIEFMNEDLLIDTSNMTISYTILSDIYETIGKEPPHQEDIRFKHYTLVD